MVIIVFLMISSVNLLKTYPLFNYFNHFIFTFLFYIFSSWWSLTETRQKYLWRFKLLDI